MKMLKDLGLVVLKCGFIALIIGLYLGATSYGKPFYKQDLPFIFTNIQDENYKADKTTRQEATIMAMRCYIMDNIAADMAVENFYDTLKVTGEVNVKSYKMLMDVVLRGCAMKDEVLYEFWTRKGNGAKEMLTAMKLIEFYHISRKDFMIDLRGAE